MFARLGIEGQESKAGSVWVVLIFTAMVSMSERSAGGPHFSAMRVQFPSPKAGGVLEAWILWV